ncbi:hypothetical protein A3I48_02540 [Candidatus Daviesbacteria bacterium RIFCSPLOWO2_02_FULL_36_7]|uniref:Fibronectin type-III domain-containing protein n=1 Tax=Candidatus Daviesbacteria bacterium RIFCSPLOWO2_02_FULL_36_7 TaxID=1797792 RepID=A0A1F5MIC4_9BACT|nr:MAG: hypothetical protein A3I48_02540 [Candidatus Daviesbacteria bacterium RIFCSPLOWO2_02_FULL_36_7]
MILAIILLIAGLLVINQPTYAIDSPILISPTNNTTVSSSKLTWQQVTDSIQYRVIVDDEASIKSPYVKNYYLTNINYSPQLNPGTYYWKVGAKDSNSTWFWSDTWSFILTSPASSTSPTPSQTPTPTITPSPSPAPASSSSFTITNIPSQINSDQSFSVSVNITSSTAYFCKGAFKKVGSSNYFGFNLVSGNWIKNSSSSTNQYLCTNSFNLEVKPDIDDSGYTGSGDYIFKVGSYDKNGGSLTWSNEVIININNIDTSDLPAQTTAQIIPSANPANSTTSTLVSSTPKSNISLKSIYRIASVAAATASATPSGKIEIKNEKQINPLVWVGLFFIFAGIGALGYIYLIKNAKIHIPFGR